jgi:hypothetical protein
MIWYFLLVSNYGTEQLLFPPNDNNQLPEVIKESQNFNRNSNNESMNPSDLSSSYINTTNS